MRLSKSTGLIDTVGESFGDEYIRVKAGWFSNLALGQQCAWAVPGDFSVSERDNTIHCWDGGENRDASNARDQAVQIRVIVPGRGGVQKIRLERKLFNVVFSRCPARGWWCPALDFLYSHRRPRC